MATTLNPLDKGSACTLSNGNLSYAAPRQNGLVRSTTSKITGKWYFEVVVNTTAIHFPAIGFCSTTHPTSEGDVGSGTGGCNCAQQSYVNNGAWTSSSVVFSNGNVVGIRLNADEKTAAFYVNNSLIRTVSFSFSGGIFAAGGAADQNAGLATFRFDKSSFSYPVPAGYYGWDEIPPITISTRKIYFPNALLSTSIGQK